MDCGSFPDALLEKIPIVLEGSTPKHKDWEEIQKQLLGTAYSSGDKEMNELHTQITRQVELTGRPLLQPRLCQTTAQVDVIEADSLVGHVGHSYAQEDRVLHISNEFSRQNM